MNQNPQDGFNQRARRFADNTLGRLLVGTGATPNRVTLGGALICAAGCLVWSLQISHPSLFWWGLGVFLFGSLGDWLDGSVARVSNMKTEFGKQLDSLVDRFVEMAMFAALGLVFAKQHNEVLLLGCFTALGGSFIVTYARQRAESLGLKGDVGLGDRSTRMLVLGVFVIAGHWIGFGWAVYAVNALAWSTAVHRTLWIRQQLEGRSTLIAPDTRRFAGMLTFLAVATAMIFYLGIEPPW